jgi:hypothetical protein
LNGISRSGVLALVFFAFFAFAALALGEAFLAITFMRHLILSTGRAAAARILPRYTPGERRRPSLWL